MSAEEHSQQRKRNLTLHHQSVETLCLFSNSHTKNTGRRKSPDSSNSSINCRHRGYFATEKSYQCIGCTGHCDPEDSFKKTISNLPPFCPSCYPNHLQDQPHPNLRKPGSPQESNTWLYMVVWLTSVLSYINGLTGDFVHDDLSAITSNPDVTGANPLYQTFLNDYWGRPLSHPLSHKSYRPFTILTFR